MNEARKSLPQGWAKISIGSVVVEKVPQITPQKDLDFVYVDIASIDNETKQIVSPKRISGKQPPSRARQSIAKNDVVVSMTRPNLNAVSIITADLAGSIASTGFDALRPITIEPFWLFYSVCSQDFVHEMGELVRGALYPAIKSTDIRNYQIPIPPLEEQKRIVARIEELQARSRRAKEALEAIPDLLEQLRRSILSAAFRGALTKEWREKHLDVEPASELLKRIHTERRKRWEEAEREKLKTKGLSGDKLDEELAKRRKKYKEPAPVDTSGLPDLPQGWCWASIEELSQWTTDGTHQPPPFTNRGIPFLVISNMVSGDIAWDTVQKWVSKETYDKYTGIYKPALGDIIYSTVGSYGVAVEVTTHKKFMFQRHIAHIRPISNHLSVSYLSFALNSPICKEQADAAARGVAQKTVNLFDLRRFAIPFAPLSEQNKLKELLTKCSEALDNQWQNLNSSLAKLHNFEQSILSKAFCGELVPQDPNDEPASVLLERIRQEKARAVVRPKVKDKRKGKKPVVLQREALWPP